MQGRILASKDQRAAGKKCRGHLLGNMPERGGQNRDQFMLEEWDRLEPRIFHQTQERHRRATRSAQGYFHSCDGNPQWVDCSLLRRAVAREVSNAVRLDCLCRRDVGIAAGCIALLELGKSASIERTRQLRIES